MSHTLHKESSLSWSLVSLIELLDNENSLCNHVYTSISLGVPPAKDYRSTENRVQILLRKLGMLQCTHSFPVSHNFSAALPVLAGSIMSMHYTSIVHHSLGCPTIVTEGLSETGKSTAKAIALSITGEDCGWLLAKFHASLLLQEHRVHILCRKIMCVVIAILY